MRWILACVAFGSALLVCLLFLLRADCDFYRAAVPPSTIDIVDSKDVKIKDLVMNLENPLLSQISLSPGASIEVHLTAETDTSQWRWNLFGAGEIANRARRKQERLPRPVFKLQFVRRSSLPPGELAYSGALSNARRIDGKRMDWNCKCRVPKAPGVYRVRLSIGKRYLSGGEPSQRDPDDVTFDLLSSFDVRVQD